MKKIIAPRSSRAPALAALGVGLALGSVSCGGEELPEDPNACVTTADCDLDSEVCHPFLKTCVISTCDSSADCGGRTPVCNIDANGPPIDDPAYANLCVCNAESCPDGQICSPEGGVCVDAGGGCTGDLDCGEGELCDLGTGLCFAACDKPGLTGAGPCAGSQVCLPDGTCAQPCEDMACLPTQACSDDIESSRFNACVDPSEVSSACTNALNHADTYEDGAPIIVDVDFIDNLGSVAGCSVDVQRYQAVIYSMDGFSDRLLSDMAVVFVDRSGNESVPFSVAPGDPQQATINPEITPDPDNDDRFFLRFSLCVQDGSASFAIFVEDAMDDASNLYCF